MSVTVHHGDSRDVVREMADASVDSCVCDPPYALVSIGKRFGADNAAPAKAGKSGAYARASAGFMGQKWDTGEVAFDPAFWADVLRVLKPGGHVLAFGGTRTYHRLAVAIEDAGFDIRDAIQWLYGSGFPKSHNAGNGWGTALKPACEIICVARKPLIGTVAANVLQHGTGALNIDACRVEGQPRDFWNATTRHSGQFGGGGQNSGTRGYVEGGDKGRWPANVVHDGSDEVVDAFPFSAGQQRAVGPEFKPKTGTAVYGDYGPRPVVEPRNDAGSAARFFYTAKADAADRLGSKHPTVKPVDLMRWLVRLVTPPGGTVLDPFAGSGTTGMACLAEGFNAVLIEREAAYVADIRHRIAHVSGQDAPLFATSAA